MAQRIFVFKKNSRNFYPRFPQDAAKRYYPVPSPPSAEYGGEAWHIGERIAYVLNLGVWL